MWVKADTKEWNERLKFAGFDSAAPDKMDWTSWRCSKPLKQLDRCQQKIN